MNPILDIPLELSADDLKTLEISRRQAKNGEFIESSKLHKILRKELETAEAQLVSNKTKDMDAENLITENDKKAMRESIDTLIAVNAKTKPLEPKTYFSHLFQYMCDTDQSIEKLCINPIYKSMHDYLTEELSLTISSNLTEISLNDYNVWLMNLRLYNRAKSFLAGMYACYRTRVLFNKTNDFKDETEVVWEEVKGLVLGCIQANTFNFPLDYTVK